MKQEIENIIKKNLPMKYELSDENYDLKQIHISYNEAIDDIDTSLIADEVLKITKCNCCDEEDEHIFKDDRSTTRISRPCSGCGKHQTIAGALLKSKEWEKWYKYASENMLFDVDETLTVDAMSDEHWNSFMKFLNDEVLKVVVEATINMLKDESMLAECITKTLGYGHHYSTMPVLRGIVSEIEKKLLSEHLSPNKENKNNG